MDDFRHGICLLVSHSHEQKLNNQKFSSGNKKVFCHEGVKIGFCHAVKKKEFYL